MAMNMDDNMQKMMADMHRQNYAYDMQLAKHFQNISDIYVSMAQGENQMYQFHAGQMSGMDRGMPMPPRITY